MKITYTNYLSILFLLNIIFLTVYSEVSSNFLLQEYNKPFILLGFYEKSRCEIRSTGYKSINPDFFNFDMYHMDISSILDDSFITYKFSAPTDNDVYSKVFISYDSGKEGSIEVFVDDVLAVSKVTTRNSGGYRDSMVLYKHQLPVKLTPGIHSITLKFTDGLIIWGLSVVPEDQLLIAQDYKHDCKLYDKGFYSQPIRDGGVPSLGYITKNDSFEYLVYSEGKPNAVFIRIYQSWAQKCVGNLVYNCDTAPIGIYLDNKFYGTLSKDTGKYGRFEWTHKLSLNSISQGFHRLKFVLQGSPVDLAQFEFSF